jgi:S1-C subfamily serine protease
MEGLNKQQLILLALLVSFVTSIATGIVTVSLVNQAPPAVTQTINRVVEKTIERVITEPSKQAAAVTTKETVVVKADDLVIEAIEKNTGSIVRIKEATGDGDARRELFAALGLIVSKDGLIASDLSVAYRKTDEHGASVGESYLGVLPDGKRVALNIVSSDQAAGLIFFQPFLQEREKGTIRFAPPQFRSTGLKLGQAVVALSGDEGNAVSTGIIANLVTKAAAVGEKEVTFIKTDIRSADLVLGSVLLNLSGEVIGINAGAGIGASRNTFLPIQKVLDALAKAALQ